MPISTLTNKGEITLPKEIREHLQVAAGDRLEFLIAEDGTVQLRAAAGSVRRLAGLFHRDGDTALSVTEMDQAISDLVAEDDRRIRIGNRES